MGALPLPSSPPQTTLDFHISQLGASLAGLSACHQGAARNPDTVAASIEMGAVEVRSCVNAEADGTTLASQIGELFCDVVLLAHLFQVDLDEQAGVYIDKWVAPSQPDLRQVP